MSLSAINAGPLEGRESDLTDPGLAIARAMPKGGSGAAGDPLGGVIGDVGPGGVLRNRSTVIQQKTGRPAPFEIAERRHRHVTWR